MTLIVLEIRVPDAGPIRSEQDLWNALLGLGPRLLTYFLSFLTLGIFWNGQQTQLNLFASADRDLSWLQLAFLATIALMPFSTSLLAEFITYRLALLAYWVNIFSIGLLLYLNWILRDAEGSRYERGDACCVGRGEAPDLRRAVPLCIWRAA